MVYFYSYFNTHMSRMINNRFNRIRNRYFFLIKQLIFKKFSFSILLAIIICSCSSMQKITVQVSTPPLHPVSPEIQSLAILNRSLTRNFTNLGRDSLEKILVNSELDLDTVMLDSVAADTAIQVAAKALFESDRFDVVVPVQRNLIRNDQGGLRAPLDKDFIEKICKDFKVNAVLVLESFSEKIMTNLDVQRFWYGFDVERYADQYKGTINLAYNLEWRLYKPFLNPPIERYNTKDTVFWNSFDYSLRNMYDKLPSLKEVLIGGGIAAGLDMADNISPKWNDEMRRYYITGNKEADAAVPLIKADKWEEAAEVWKKFAGASSKNLRSKVEYNLALAAEMTGDMDSAIEWATKSYKTKYSAKTESYLKYLNQRRKLFQKTSKINLPNN